MHKCSVLIYNSMCYRVGHAVLFDDTEGYFVIGGGKYIRGVEGYFGPVIYYRNRIPAGSMVIWLLLLTLLSVSTAFESDSFCPLQSEVPDVIKEVNLTGWLQTCHEFRLEMAVRISGSSLKAKQRTESGSRLLYPLGGAKIMHIFFKNKCRATEGTSKVLFLQKHVVVLFMSGC